MREINIEVSPQYRVVVGDGLLSQVGEYINKIGCYNKVAIVTDDVVASLYLQSVTDSLKGACSNVYTYAFAHGESSKSMQTLSDIYDFLASSEITRSDLIIALGGGVVGDIVGYASSSYLRGVDFINIPTTLLSMVDSSVGGKTAVNISAGKNLVGAFYQPKIVLCDTSVISTLSDELIADGVGEIAKYAVLENENIFDDLLSNNITNCLEDLISKCVKIKNDYVACDVFDTGKRQLLNLGHTLGHAIEKHSRYAVSHGKSVLMGLYMLAEQFAGTDGIDDILKQIEKVGKKYNMKVRYDISARELWALAVNDKKRHGDYITLARPFAIGDCALDDVIISNNINLTEMVKKSTYDVIVKGVKLSGEIAAPPSKSDMHRLLIAGGFCGSKITINNVNYNDDINATISALQALGVNVKKDKNSVILLAGKIPEKANIDCKECGTTFRFFLPICAMLGVNTTFTGSERLGDRGYKDIISAMQHKVSFSKSSGFPLNICGIYDDSEINISGAISSQFVSGILLGSFARKKSILVNIKDQLQSADYVAMTLHTLSKFGGISKSTLNSILFESTNKVNVDKFDVESDFSNGAFFNVAGVKTNYNNHNSLQGDKRIIQIVESAYSDNKPFDVSVKNIPDLAIILSVLATRLNGVSVLRDCGRLRLKECDRLDAILKIMKSCKIDAVLKGDDLFITGGEAGGDFEMDSFGDHRVAMSLAVLATFAGNIRINNAGVVAKSYPDFWDDFMRLGGKIDVINIR